ncbi:Fungal-trans domain-containing protein [Fusarium falciforme]|uniref:Fungal-trans domain-containing protein n=1 Tax=Fusarium falciforme TaxID=195108 RepID=UPI0023019FA1|nr:Fungal-trans domain-containing protein [Fusarium falciforme]WAO87809.1 Fungal-trans domain-containing protein [Fusarium falciforme]
MRMGLHRDPAHWPTIRPLQAELRRRIWMTLYDMDFFTSTQVGLPRIIKDSQCDTHPPAHLLDGDISLEHDEAPDERPLTEPSSLLYIIQRHRIITLAAEIYDATEGGLPLAATISALSTKLEETVEPIPAWLKHKTLEASIADNPITILYRMFLDILIHKAVYLLHRRAFVKSSSGEENAKSSKACIDAALAILPSVISDHANAGVDLFKNIPGVIAPGHRDPFEDMALDPSLFGMFGSMPGDLTL